MNLRRPYRLAFRGDLLLVSDCDSATKADAIVTLGAPGGELSAHQTFIEPRTNASIGAWAFVGNRLVIWDPITKDLLIYSY